MRACVFSQPVTAEEKTGACSVLGIICGLSLRSDSRQALGTAAVFFVFFFPPSLFFKVHVGGGGAQQCVAA